MTENHKQMTKQTTIVVIGSLRVKISVVSAPNFESQGPRFESSWRQNSAHNCMAVHYTEPFVIIPTSSQYDLNNVERDVKHQIIIIMCSKFKINIVRG